MRGNKENPATAAGNPRVSDQNLPMVNLLAICTIRPDRSPHPGAKPLRPTGDSRHITIHVEQSSDYSSVMDKQNCGSDLR
jgi:hypothetical protein